ncbi:MAG: electron transfer flavoprotein subunit alpha, partial [Anaerolineae bacterium]
MSILVYVDHLKGSAKPISWEIMGKAREFAETLGVPVVALVVGEGVDSVATDAIAYGADRVLVVDGPAFAQFRAHACTAALKAAIEAA